MKNIVFHIFNLIFCISFLSANAQELKWSQPQKMTERAYITDIIGQNSEGIFILKKSARQPERNVILEHYSKDMRLLHSQTFAADKDEYFVQLIMLKNRLQLYFAKRNKESKGIELLAKSLDFKLTQQGNDSILATMPGGDFSDRKLQAYKPQGRGQTLILFTKQTTQISSNFNYILIDTAISSPLTGEINIAIENAFEIENAAFTSKNIALLLRETVKRKVNKLGYQYYIIQSKLGASASKTIPLFNENIIVAEGLLKTDYVNDNIVFSGLYNLQDSAYVKGYYLWIHFLGKDSTASSFAPFPPDLVQEMAGKTSRVHGIYNLRSGDMILRKDGGVVLTSEEYEETREAVMDMNMYGVSQTNFRYYFYYENMLVLSINPDGKLDWHSVLRKEQVSVNDNGTYSSYSVSATADKLIYVYNDLSRKSWNLSLYEVNSDGSTNNKIILRAQDYDAKLIPQYARQISYNELLIPGINRKGFVFLKVTL